MGLRSSLVPALARGKVPEHGYLQSGYHEYGALHETVYRSSHPHFLLQLVITTGLLLGTTRLYVLTSKKGLDKIDNLHIGEGVGISSTASFPDPRHSKNKQKSRVRYSDKEYTHNIFKKNYSSLEERAHCFQMFF
jgi:hypothetical protein